MPGQEFFRKLGLYVQPDFLDAATCARIRDEMRRVAADKEMIAVRGEDGQLEEVLDESGRRCGELVSQGLPRSESPRSSRH
jgi:hypothetical protein